LSLARSFLIGDRAKDIDAGHAAGCTTVLIESGKAEPAPHATPDAQVSSLAEAVKWVMRRLDADT
jgi:D-glycero-D-manno-heptose 1,7-bisphosphate phosphatase